jgi:hypothetical protein
MILLSVTFKKFLIVGWELYFFVYGDKVWDEEVTQLYCLLFILIYLYTK